MDQYIGKLLDNRYEIMEQIGMGGMARVFRALDHRLNRQVAVKILREDLAEDAELRRRFHEESQAVAMLSHPNIVAVYDVSRSSDVEYIVMELIDGITLKQYMQKKGNKLNWREALHFITQIVKALGHAHSRGIIHRDIKPHNIMVLRDGSVKVADFGIARVASGGHSTLTQEALGSVHYISPEQARGSHIDARSDLYSAGVVLYEMITGRLPFEGDTPVSVAIQHINSIPLSPREIDPAIPEALEAITMKAMAPDPDNRYLSADDMLADLEEFRKNPNINFDYNVSGFQDDEDDVDKTQVLPTAASISRVGSRVREPERVQNRSRSNPPPRHREREEDEEEYDDGPRRPNWPIIGAVAAILVFVAALLYIMFSTAFSGSLGAQTQNIRVPSVTGQLFSEAQANTELLNGFTLVQGETVESDKPAGTILQQSPNANDFVSGDDMTITVTVSSGEAEEVLMPPLEGKTLAQALSALQVDLDLGLSVDYDSRSEYHDTIPEGCVISTIPEEGTVLSEGQQVILVMSLGKEETPMVMPNLIGMDEETAKKTITDMGLVVGQVQPSPSDEQEAGKVWYQSVAVNASVTEGTTVDIFVSTGPSGGSGSGDTVTKTFTLTLPTNLGEDLHVEVVDSQEQTVFSGDYNTNLDTAAEIPVSGSGVQTYTIYINGHSYTQQTVDFGA
ncbi:Stk1 family PASTA domain-containing Ser/Thr kinase [Pseudoflavonifractor capillosus]|uniref:Stk1 family PASTA domain-containing Ser/Thr kinase n=1 Tax=Pseudoflavonifractor capillosus TaxID=106588 RepID=UPI0031F752B7